MECTSIAKGRLSLLKQLESSCLHYLLPDKHDPSVVDGLQHPINFETVKSGTVKFRNFSFHMFLFCCFFFIFGINFL